jgi:hypothetical protein
VSIFLACTLLTNPVQAQMAYCVVILVFIHVLFNWHVDFWAIYERMKDRRDNKNAGKELYPYDVMDEDLEKYMVENNHPDCINEANKPSPSHKSVSVPPQGELTTKSNIDVVEHGAGDQSLARAKDMGFL